MNSDKTSSAACTAAASPVNTMLFLASLLFALPGCMPGTVKPTGSAAALPHKVVDRRRFSGVPAPEAVFQAGLPRNAVDANTMVAHFIDVGQGDAALLEFSCGVVLIDTGGEKTDEVSGRENLKAYLNAFFQTHSRPAWTLDLVVLSHPHIDHTDGVAGLFELQPSITIRNVVDNGETKTGSGISGQKQLQKYAADNGANYQGIVEADIKTTAGLTNRTIDPVDCRSDGGIDPKITALWGHVDSSVSWSKNANNDSVVLRVDFGKASFLFTGDLEEEAINAMLQSYADDLSLLDVDVLKVDHHGSKNGMTPDFVNAITPKIAVIQAGDSTLSHATFSAYSYGHPNRQSIQELLAAPSGVSMSRPSARVRVGLSGRNPGTNAPPRFTQMTIDKAIYSNAWDGNIAITATKDGQYTVETGF